MSGRRIQITVFLSVGLGLITAARAGSLVVILRPEATGWQFSSAEKITVNGKPKIRLGQAGQTDVRADEYKKLTAEPMGQVPIRAHAAGYLAHRSGSGWAPIAPDGASVKTSASYASLWSAARLQVAQDKNSKGSEINVSEVFAILPGSDPSETVADFLSDEANFTGVGEKDAAAAFEERMSLLVAAAGSATEPAAARLKSMLLGAMEPAIVQSNTGIAKYSDLEKALTFAAVSERAFPADPQQKAARDALRSRKQWLDQLTAVLRAFAAGELWDPFIEKYGEYERFDNSFPEVRKLRETSFRESARQHLEEGRRLFKEKQFSAALPEIKLALMRNPADKEVQGLLDTFRIEDVNARRSQLKPRPLDSKSTEQLLKQRLATAERAMEDHNLARAEAEIAAAEAVDKEFPRTILVHAKLLQARQELAKALELLDSYDRRVVSANEIDEGNLLRGKIVYDLDARKAEKAAEVAKAEASGDYAAAMEAARFGVRIDPEDPEFLYHAGFNSAILRKEKDAGDYLRRYLKVSQTLNSDAKLRAAVFSVLPIVSAKHEEPKGKPNWFSGFSSESFYCPVSLMPNVRAGEVRSSHKQTTSFDWRNGSLVSVSTVNTGPGENNSKIFFDYFPGGKSVRRIGTEAFANEEVATPKLTPEGTIGAGKGTYFALFNHPVVNPYMVERLTGKRVATVVAGNPYFHPFVWTAIHTFIAEYDDSGRLRSAKEINVKNGTPHVLAFEWQGNRLMSIAEHGASPGEYRREMHYSGDQLAGETVHFQGKNSKIEYRYNGSQLVEAICDNDFSIDGRSRRVSFRE